jgi:hypothetical protein
MVYRRHQGHRPLNIVVIEKSWARAVEVDDVTEGKIICLPALPDPAASIS